MHICADLGGTRSAAALFDDGGNVRARFASGPAGALSLGVEATLQALAILTAGLGVPDAGQCDLVLGLAGVSLRDRIAVLEDALAAYRQVTIVGDGYGALVDVTKGQPGMVIAVGTGVAAMRLDADGCVRTASGWGFPAGDLGSGAWIGLQAVGALTRALDQPDLCSADFRQRLSAIVGDTASAVMGFATTSRAGVFARLAPVVVQAATDGEPVARDIMARAAAEIWQVAEALSDGDRSLTVHLSGGLGAVVAPYLRAHDPDRHWRPCSPDPLRGLSMMHRGEAPLERLVPRPGLSEPDY
nr:BadF/BadG/BcrA/BcrD ATPase family protein [uncultured Celeribacter sp.]